MKNSEDGSSRTRAPYEKTTGGAVVSTLTDVQRQISTLVDQRPVFAVLAAIGLGFVVARVAARL